MLPFEQAEQRRRFSPGLHAGRGSPGTTGPLLGCPIPTAQHIMESRAQPPGQGTAGPPWSSPAAVSRWRWHWGQLLAGSCPALATRPSPLPLGLFLHEEQGTSLRSHMAAALAHSPPWGAPTG